MKFDYKHLETLTGRFKAFKQYYPSTPKNKYSGQWFKHQQELIDRSKFWDALLKLDYASIEAKMLKEMAAEYLDAKNSQGLPQVVTPEIKAAMFRDVTDIRPRGKPITIMGRPVELNELETFQVEISVPAQTYADLYVTTFREKIQEIQPCQCEMKILMSAGCQCGGR